MNNLSIRASAGSGKTYQLTNRYLKLLTLGISPERVLATTFTRKAAGEILSRILTRLAQAARDPENCQALAGAIGQPQLTPAVALALLRRTVRNLHSLRVATLDSFFAQLAGSYCLEIGLPAGWKIVDEVIDRQLRMESIREILAANASDVAALMPLLTKGEATRSISEQIEEIVLVMYALFLETPEEAWHRLPKPRPLPDSDLRAAIEALSQLALPATKMTSARDVDCQRALDWNWEEFVKCGIPKKLLAGDETFANKTIPASAIRIYEQLLDHARAILVGRLAQQTEATFLLLRHFHHAYQRRKFASGAVRFDDVTRALASIANLDSWTQSATRMDATVDHLLLDEFQDTSLLQWQALFPVARRLLEPEGEQRSRTFFSVGDPKQAIYGWRGGCAELFDTLESFPTIEWQPLATSYRSSPVIMEVVNEVFAHLRHNPALARYPSSAARWAARYESHSTARTTLPGYACLQVASAPQGLESQSMATLAFAAAEVQRLTTAAPWASIGVLMRDNAAVAKMISNLKMLQIPASEEGGTPIADSPAVSLILSLLALADHPGDTAAAYHVARSPLGRAVKLTSQEPAERHRVARRIRRQLAEDGYGKCVRQWSRALAPDCDQRDRDRLEALISLAYRYEPAAAARASDFIEHVRVTRCEDATYSQVRVMTIHQSKGLEFDIVLLPQLDKRLIGQTPRFVVRRPVTTSPIDIVCRYANAATQKLLDADMQEMFAAEDDRKIRESLCLLYVALTRAVHALHMIVAPTTSTKLTTTFSGVLRGALTSDVSLVPGKILFEAGTKDWHEQVQHPPRPITTPLLPAAPAEQTALPFRPPAKHTRHLTRKTPSSLEGGAHIDLRQVLRIDPKQSLDRGVLFHRLFEQIEWLDDDRVPLTSLSPLLRRFRMSTDEEEAILAELATMLSDPAVQSALSRARYLKSPDETLTLWRERPFAFRDQEVLWEGIFDRLVVVHRDGRPVRADILDFKTDQLDPQDTAAINTRVAYYRPQIEAYRKAAQRLLGLKEDKITTTLLFVCAKISAAL